MAWLDQVEAVHTHMRWADGLDRRNARVHQWISRLKEEEEGIRLASIDARMLAGLERL